MILVILYECDNDNSDYYHLTLIYLYITEIVCVCMIV